MDFRSSSFEGSGLDDDDQFEEPQRPRTKILHHASRKGRPGRLRTLSFPTGAFVIEARCSAASASAGIHCTGVDRFLPWYCTRIPPSGPQGAGVKVYRPLKLLCELKKTRGFVKKNCYFCLKEIRYVYGDQRCL